MSDAVFTEPLSLDAPAEQDDVPDRPRGSRSLSDTLPRSGRPARRSIATAQKQALFLHAFSQCGILRDGCQAADVTRQTVYNWRKDEVFAALFDQASEEAADRVEREAVRRAVEGWDEPVYQGGKKIGSVRRYSDNLLAVLLKGRKPAYRDQKVTNQTNNVQNNVAVIPIEKLSDEEFRLLGKIMGKAAPKRIS